MRLKRVPKAFYLLALILTVQGLILISLPFPSDLWWDECTYQLLAQEVIEHPLLFHIDIVGWHIGSKDPHLFSWILALLGGDAWRGMVFVVLCSLAFTVLYFTLVKQEAGDAPAFLAALIMLSSFQFLFLSKRLFTEIPSLLLCTGMLIALEIKQYRLSGILFGLSIITRYPNVVLIAPALCAIYKERDWQKALLDMILPASAIMSIQFILSDMLEYGHIFSSPINSFSVFSSAPSSDPLFYFRALFEFNPLIFVFFPIGAFVAYKERRWLLLSWFFAFLVFHQLIAHKELRYSVELLPGFTAIGVLGFYRVAKAAFGARQYLVTLLMLILVVYSFSDVGDKMREIERLAGNVPLVHETAEIVGRNSVASNYFIPLTCVSDAKVYLMPHSIDEFRVIAPNVTYIAIFSDDSLGVKDKSFEYLNDTDFERISHWDAKRPPPSSVDVFRKKDQK